MSRRSSRFARRVQAGTLFRTNDFRVRAFPIPASELAARNDKFPSGEFNQAAWSAEMVSAPAEIRDLLDSFRLVGREIWDIWTASFDYAHNGRNLEDAIFADLKDRVQLPEEQVQAGSSARAPARRAKIPRCMELDEPFVLEFKTGETFEIDVLNVPEWRISMDRIPVALLEGKHDNTDPGVIFSPLRGRTIKAVDLKTVQMEARGESVGAIRFRLDNGNVLEFAGFFDFLEVALLDRNGKVRSASMESLQRAFFNYEDLHFDPLTGFEAKQATLWFGWKGATKLSAHPIRLSPVRADGKVLSDLHGTRGMFFLRRGETAFIDRRDALGLVLGLCAGKPDAVVAKGPIILSTAEWGAVLETGRKFLEGERLSDDEMPLTRLLFEVSPPACPPPFGKATDKERMRMKRERCRICLAELGRWSRKAIPLGGGMRIDL